LRQETTEEILEKELSKRLKESKREIVAKHDSRKFFKDIIIKLISQIDLLNLFPLVIRWGRGYREFNHS
jgi:hypothetical protein